MKIKNLLIVSFLVAIGPLCFAQDAPGADSAKPKDFKLGKSQPYYVLKAGKKSVGISMALENSFDLKSIEPESIKQIDVLKGQQATDQYGALGSNGVIVITFKNFATLPQELKDRFKETK